jgi:hypothetical protein
MSLDPRSARHIEESIWRIEELLGRPSKPSGDTPTSYLGASATWSRSVRRSVRTPVEDRALGADLDQRAPGPLLVPKFLDMARVMSGRRVFDVASAMTWRHR